MPTSDISNNSFATATRLTGITNAPQGGVDQVLNTTTNPLDFYRFSTVGSTNLRINLTGIKGDVQLSLYKVASDTAIPTEANKVSLRPGSTGTVAESYTSTSDPLVLGDIAPGTYYIKVEQAGVALPESTYSLSVFASTTQDTISALWRNPNGGLDAWQMAGNTVDTKGQFSASDAPAGLQMIGSGDFNADGIDDILWKDSVKKTFVLWFMENGTIRKSTAEIQDATGVSFARSDDWAIVGLDDIDGDGFTDILLRNQTTGELDSWFMNENQVMKAVNLTNGFRVYSDWQILGFSKSRIFWRNVNSSVTATWEISQNGLDKSRALSFQVPQDWQVVAFRDFNNDGIADVVWRNSQVQSLAVWQMSSTSSDPVRTKAYALPNDYRISTIADFNGDKRPDILFWNPINGEIANWETQQDVINFNQQYVTYSEDNGVSFKRLNIKTDAYEAVISSDFDGDQKAEILWREKTSGQTAFWKMDGSIFQKSGLLEIVPLTSVAAGINYPGYKAVSSLKASTKKIPQFTAGTLRSNAFDLGVLDGSGSFLDAIGGPSSSADRADWYRFKVEIPSLLTGLNITGANLGNAKVEVFTDRGSQSNVAFTQAELLQVLNPETNGAAKTYYVRVTPDSTKQSTSIPYTFNVTGRLGITNLTAKTITIDKTSLALNTDPAQNQVRVTGLSFENNGDFAANNVTIGYYLSRDGILDANDRRLTGTTSVGTVARGIAEKVNPDGTITPGTPNRVTLSTNPVITLNLPGANDAFWSQSGGNYQIIAVIDPDKVISNEKNRDDNAIASTAITITQSGGIDLRGNGFTNTTPSVSKTGTVSGTFTIQNLGGVTLAAGQSLKVKFYFSTDATISSNSDLFLKEVIITSAISASGSLTQNFSFALPTDPDAEIYWGDNKTGTSTQLSGFIGMIIDTTGSNIIDTNVLNNLNQGLAKDIAALTVTGL